MINVLGGISLPQQREPEKGLRGARVANKFPKRKPKRLPVANRELILKR